MKLWEMLSISSSLSFKMTLPNISEERRKELSAFLSERGFSLRNLSLLDLAFRHSSSVNTPGAFQGNNERLEFLGDTVLDLVTAEYLFEKFPQKDEGDLSRMKSVVVSETVLSEVALRFGVDSLVILGRGEVLSGGNRKRAILADAMEAIIAVFFLDGGYEKASQFVLSFIPDEVMKVVNDTAHRDYKTLIQEFSQRVFKVSPKYETAYMEGPEHDRTFFMVCMVGHRKYGPAPGKSKKDGEQAAAKLAWQALCQREKS